MNSRKQEWVGYESLGIGPGNPNPFRTLVVTSNTTIVKRVGNPG